MSDVKYQPKKLKMKDQHVNFVPSCIHFHYWDKHENGYIPVGSLQWNGDEWTVAEGSSSSEALQYLLQTTRSFCGKTYSKSDVDFYKPFYYIPTTGMKVTVGHSNNDLTHIKAHDSVPHVPREVHEEMRH
jgi:hypothetical protein